jgi:multidrug transporter EmrE-like cation transporter
MRDQVPYLALLVVIGVVNSASQLLMRWGGTQAAEGAAPTLWRWIWVSRWWLSGILVGWVAGLGWAWCLRRLSLGLAIPLYAGLVYVLSILGGVCFLKERLSPLQLLGIATILFGIVLVTFSSAPPHPHTASLTAHRPDPSGSDP